MSQPLDSDNPNATESLDRPSGRTMSMISIALFAHLFLVFVALSSNLRPWNSELQTTLVNRFSAYLKPLVLDPEFRRFHITHGTPSEDNHILRVELTESSNADTDEPSESTDSPWRENVILPRGGNRFLPNYHRYLRLAQHLGSMAEREEDARTAQLARAIGNHFLRRFNARHAVVGCRRVETQPMLLSDLTEGFPSDPTDEAYEQSAYAANVIRSDDGQVLVGKISSQRESAGAVPSRKDR